MRTLKFRAGSPKVSIILLDWAVRESFHTLDYLNNQTVPRSHYELIWIEFFDHVPDGLAKKVAELEARGLPGLEQWVVMESPRSVHLHKHVAYNAGIALARGDICVISDSDAMYPENFVAKIIETFAGQKKLAVHVDQVRNYNRKFYPFNYPTVAEVLADRDTANYSEGMTTGVAAIDGRRDSLHAVNYGACLAAPRASLIQVGGADEQTGYAGYFCGPYDLTFRLVNAGHDEIWLRDLFLVHTWHPGDGGLGDVGGAQDGKGMATVALEAKAAGRVMPVSANPAIRALRENPDSNRDEVLAILSRVDQSHLDRKNLDLRPVNIARDHGIHPKLVKELPDAGYNIVAYRSTYYAVPLRQGAFETDMADEGRYAKLIHGRAYKAVLAEAVSKPVPVPRLIAANIRRCNIVLYKSVYYAFPKCIGAFDPTKADAGEYAAVLTAATQSDVLNSLKQAPWNYARPQFFRRVRRLARYVRGRLPPRQRIKGALYPLWLLATSQKPGRQVTPGLDRSAAE